MFKALVLLCSFGATPNVSDCSIDNANSVMRVPGDFASPVTCFMHGQAYLAGAGLVGESERDRYVKVVCTTTLPFGGVPTVDAEMFQMAPDE